jgi:hypothetical protein
MSEPSAQDKLLIRLYKQLSGKITEKDSPVPEAAIRGTGYIWCLKLPRAQVIRIPRGIKCYVIDKKNAGGRVKVYTTMGHTVLISEKELIYTGFD